MSSGETETAPGDRDKENIAGDGKKTLRIKIISMGAPETGKVTICELIMTRSQISFSRAV